MKPFIEVYFLEPGKLLDWNSGSIKPLIAPVYIISQSPIVAPHKSIYIIYFLFRSFSPLRFEVWTPVYPTDAICGLLCPISSIWIPKKWLLKLLQARQRYTNSGSKSDLKCQPLGSRNLPGSMLSDLWRQHWKSCPEWCWYAEIFRTRQVYLRIWLERWRAQQMLPGCQ